MPNEMTDLPTLAARFASEALDWPFYVDTDEDKDWSRPSFTKLNNGQIMIHFDFLGRGLVGQVWDPERNGSHLRVVKAALWKYGVLLIKYNFDGSVDVSLWNQKHEGGPYFEWHDRVRAVKDTKYGEFAEHEAILACLRQLMEGGTNE